MPSRLASFYAVLVALAPLAAVPAPAFAADTISPSPPIVHSADYPECTEDHCGMYGGPGIAGVFEFSTLDADVVGYRYGWSSFPIEFTAGSTAAPTKVTLVPPSYGDVVLYVTAVDSAGNRSVDASYWFRVRRPKPAIAAWPLEPQPGITVDQALANRLTGGPALIPAGGFTWVDDARLMDSQAASFNGDASLATTEPILDTAGSFGVAAWAKLDALDANATVASQDGSAASAFHLGYRAESGAWCLTVRLADESEREACRSGRATTEWTHLVGTYDATAGAIRLYADGALAAESTVDIPLWAAAGSFAVGRALCDGDSCDEFTGQVVEVRAYDRTITRPEIVGTVNDLGPLMDFATVASWGFDTDWGREAVDQTSWSRVLELSGVSSIDVDGGGQVLYTGRPDGHAATFGPVLRTDGSFTIAAAAAASTLDYDAAVLSQDGSAVSAFRLEYRAAGNAWCLIVRDADDPVSAEHTACHVGVSAGAWTRLTGVYDASADEIRLYVNGSLAATTAVSAPLWNAGGPFAVGRALDDGVPADVFTGLVDDVRIFAGALTDAQVLELSQR